MIVLDQLFNAINLHNLNEEIQRRASDGERDKREVVQKMIATLEILWDYWREKSEEIKCSMVWRVTTRDYREGERRISISFYG